jgi:hypothetical protein
MTDDFETTLRTEFETRFDADEETAGSAAAKVARFRTDHDEELTAEAVIEAVESADTYDGFEHRYDLAIGTLAAATDDCTDSRAYRLAGFDDTAADPEIGA